MAVKVALHSRLRFADLFIIDSVEHWDILDLPTIVPQQDDVRYQVKRGAVERIDRLASRFYGDSRLWWVIAAANDMEIVPTDLNEGEIITIPSPRYVLQDLFKRAG
jgi:hypothetical protein